MNSSAFSYDFIIPTIIVHGIPKKKNNCQINLGITNLFSTLSSMFFTLLYVSNVSFVFELSRMISDSEIKSTGSEIILARIPTINETIIIIIPENIETILAIMQILYILQSNKVIILHNPNQNEVMRNQN